MFLHLFICNIGPAIAHLPTPEVKPPVHLTSCAVYLDKFKEETPNESVTKDVESSLDRKIRIMKERKELNEKIIEEEKAKWNPFNNPGMTKNPDNTIFVCRLVCVL